MRAVALHGSRTRSASASTANRRRQARLGNVNALRHGAFAVVNAQADVATEIELLLVAFPGLDPIADRRLVELLATTRVTRVRVLAAIDREGFTSTLTSYEYRLGDRQQRLERDLLERERARLAGAERKPVPDHLARYLPGGGA
jgi:hypothetical protein